MLVTRPRACASSALRVTAAACIRRSRFKCDVLKLAMIKNQHLAQKLFGGKVYDCVCLFEPAGQS